MKVTYLGHGTLMLTIDNKRLLYFQQRSKQLQLPAVDESLDI